jgi:hypothetical protein
VTRNPRLRADHGLPTSHARIRLREKRVDGYLALFVFEEARRRPIVLAEVGDDAVSVQSECLGEDRCRVARLALIAGKDTMDASHPRARRHRAHACSAALVERPIRNRHVRINHDVRMSDEKRPSALRVFFFALSPACVEYPGDDLLRPGDR